MAQVKGRGARALRRFGAGRAGAVVAAVLVFSVVGLAVALLGRSGGSGGFEVERLTAGAAEGTAAGEGSDAEATPAIALTVHVDGAVEVPGVYELAGEGLRLNDAVAAAGGLSEGADTSQVNLACELTDGQKVHIPFEAEALRQTGADGVAGTSSSGAAAMPGMVNLNTATASELQGLPGIGEATARAIVEDREDNGPFTSAEDLMRVSGIGEKKFSKLRDRVYV